MPKKPQRPDPEDEEITTSVDAAWLLKTPSLKGLKVIQFVC